MLTTITCCNCGVEFGMTVYFEQQRREDKRTFHCPNGHPQSYTESRADKLERQLQQEKYARERAETERDLARKREAKASKRLTRIEQRIAKGICPCCDRRFENLAQHVAEMHPEFADNNPTIMSRFRGLLTANGTHPEKA